MTDATVFFKPAEAAAFLRYSPATLAVWRSDAEGPPYIKVRGSIRYLQADLKAWAIADEPTRKLMEQSAECHRGKRELAKRPRGRAGTAQRERRLEAEPWCRDCLEDGIKRAAKEVDHIVPISQGGSDSDDNVRSLCKACHDRRTSELRAKSRADSS